MRCPAHNIVLVRGGGGGAPCGSFSDFQMFQKLTKMVLICSLGIRPLMSSDFKVVMGVLNDS